METVREGIRHGRRISGASNSFGSGALLIWGNSCDESVLQEVGALAPTFESRFEGLQPLKLQGLKALPHGRWSSDLNVGPPAVQLLFCLIV